MIVNEENIPILGEDDMEDERLVDVVYVTHDMHPSTFGYDLTQMMMFTVAHMPAGVKLGLNMITGTYVHSARQEATELLRDRKSDWVLWLDSDMRFPRDTLVRLINHQQPVVGINYAKRQVPTEYVAIKKIPTERLATTEESTGLEEVEAVGFGALLLRGDVLEALPELSEGRPWFGMTWLPEIHGWMGEDVSFCTLVRELGYRILVDHDLSKQCAHTGSFEYRLDHVDPAAVAAMVEERRAAG